MTDTGVGAEFLGHIASRSLSKYARSRTDPNSTHEVGTLQFSLRSVHPSHGKINLDRPLVPVLLLEFGQWWQLDAFG